MLFASELPKFLWTEAVQHATWIKNRMATCTLDDKTPYKMVFKSKPHLEGLPEWGSTIHILSENHGKLDECADQACWVGYSNDSQGHRIYWPGKRYMTVERNATFDHRTVIIQHEDVTEGGMDPPTSSHTPSIPPSNFHLTRAPESPYHVEDQVRNGILHGFES